MFGVLRDRNNRYCRSFFCFVIVCFLVLCTANEKTEAEKLSYSDSNNVSSILSSGDELHAIVSDEITSYSIIKNIVSKKPVTERITGSRELLNHAVVGNLFILIGTYVLFLRHFHKDLATSHRFIISYIHNLDGMKP